MQTTVEQTMLHAHGKNQVQWRTWVTPLTTGSFALTALTGLLLLFKVHIGLIKPVHEWLSLVFVAGALVHILLNWRPLVRYANRPWGRFILAVFAVLTCATLLVPAPNNGAIPEEKTLVILQHSSLAAVAKAAGRTPDEAVQLLEKQGISASSVETIDAIARNNGKELNELMRVVFRN